MLFYIKRYLSLEIVVTLLLGGAGCWAIRRYGLPFNVTPTSQVIVFGIVGSIWLALWTRLVQYGYGLFRGEIYAEQLTTALARQFADASRPK